MQQLIKLVHPVGDSLPTSRLSADFQGDDRSHGKGPGKDPELLELLTQPDCTPSDCVNMPSALQQNNARNFLVSSKTTAHSLYTQQMAATVDGTTADQFSSNQHVLETS
jgi:hypothetical protein